MNALLKKQEKFSNPLVGARVLGIDAIDKFHFKVTIDLEGMGAYWNRTITVPDEVTGEPKQETKKMPVDKLEVLVSYSDETAMWTQPKKFGSFYGWSGEPAEILWEDESGTPQSTPGMTVILNREQGCLAQKLCHFEHETDGGLKLVDGKPVMVPLSEALAAELGDNAYVIGRDGCDPCQRKLTVSAELCLELKEAAEAWGWIFTDSYQAKQEGKYTIAFDTPGCLNPKKCDGLTMKQYYPRIRIPNPNFEKREGQDDNSSTQLTRYFIACAAGLVAKVVTPTFPDRPGVHVAAGQKVPYKMFNESNYASCRTCIFRHFENRSNDPDSKMGQSSIAVVKQAGTDPVYGCALTGEWLERVWEAQQEINLQNMDADVGQPVLNAALDASVCPMYMWSIRYRRRRGMSDDDASTDKYPHHIGLYRSWIPASRAAKWYETLDLLVWEFGAGKDNLEDSNGNHIDYRTALQMWNPDVDWLNMQEGQEVVIYRDSNTGTRDTRPMQSDWLPHIEVRMPYTNLICENAVFDEATVAYIRQFTIKK